jgi:hypothetical protein
MCSLKFILCRSPYTQIFPDIGPVTDRELYQGFQPKYRATNSVEIMFSILKTIKPRKSGFLVRNI